MSGLLALVLCIAPQERTIESGIRPEVLNAVRTVAVEHLQVYKLWESFISPEKADLKAGETLGVQALSPLHDRIGQLNLHVDDPMVIAQMVLARVGYKAFRDAMTEAEASGRPLTSEDLMTVLLSPSFLDPPPSGFCPEVERIWLDWMKSKNSNARLADWSRMKGSDLDSQPMIWLPNVSHVIFGALHTPEFWQEGEKEEFVQNLLNLAGGSSVFECFSPTIEAALRPALNDDSTRGGLKTCALSPFPVDEGVGFTQSHLDFVVEFLTAEANDATFREQDFQHLPAFMGKMALRIRSELSPLDSTEALAATPEGALEVLCERYTQLLTERGWQIYWDESKRDVHHLLTDEFPHRLDKQIAKLEAEIALRSENGQLQEKLESLRSERLSDLRRLLSHITALYAGHAPAEDVRSELLRLHGYLPARLAGLRARASDPGVQAQIEQLERLQDEQRSAYFEQAWNQVCRRDPSWAIEALPRHMDKRDLPPEAVNYAINWLQQANTPAATDALFEVGIKGTPEERANVLFTPKKFSAEQASMLCDTAIADANDLLRSGGDRDTWVMLMSGTINILYQCRDQSWVPQALAKTFDCDGRSLWRKQTEFVDAGGRNPDGVKMIEWVANSLDDNTFHRLKQQGILPPKVIEARKK
jgi:hypothetical protein